MMTSFAEQIEGAVHATEFRGRQAFSWFGKPAVELTPRFQRALGRRALYEFLLSTLEAQLYRDFYCKGIATPADGASQELGPISRTPFIQELSAANRGKGGWSNGWVVTQAEAGRVRARHERTEFWMGEGDYEVRSDGQLRVGESLKVRFGKELLGISPGFYMAVGDVEATHEKNASVVRLYWNVRAGGAAALMRELTAGMNGAGVAFKFKVLTNPAAFTRCDAAVLYVAKSDYTATAEIAARVYEEIARDSLSRRTPALTKPLAPGLGLAEDPGVADDSFGSQRCRLLAEALVEANERKRSSTAERMRTVEEQFAANGVSVERPYLNRGSADTYEFELVEIKNRGSGSAGRDAAGGAANEISRARQRKYLETAVGIAARLVRDAVWDGERCNWLGAMDIERSVTPQYNESFAALGPDLYSGTSGVALFLAELHKATGDQDSRRTAIGAIRQSIGAVDGLKSAARPSLFSGWVGIALVAARTGKILGEASLERAALRLAERCERDRLENWEADLVFGKAGTITGLLLLRELLKRPTLIRLCERLGRRLIAVARKTSAGYSWESGAISSSRNLTGFSHGAAGVAYALLELAHVTGNEKYREAAEEGFRYERSCFDASRQNWPDFREQPGEPKSNRKVRKFKSFWCHGAPGIALSRLRARELFRIETCEEEAVAGFEHAQQATEFWKDSPGMNYSMCHGLAGNAEILLEGARAFPASASKMRELALEIADEGIEKHGKNGHKWPSGLSAGDTPSLMVGLAGTGYFYLRLSGRKAPSVLLMRREDWLA